MKLSSGQCNRTSVVISLQHWFNQWLGANISDKNHRLITAKFCMSTYCLFDSLLWSHRDQWVNPEMQHSRGEACYKGDASTWHYWPLVGNTKGSEMSPIVTLDHSFKGNVLNECIVISIEYWGHSLLIVREISNSVVTTKPIKEKHKP